MWREVSMFVCPGSLALITQSADYVLTDKLAVDVNMSVESRSILDL